MLVSGAEWIIAVTAPYAIFQHTAGASGYGGGVAILDHTQVKTTILQTLILATIELLRHQHTISVRAGELTITTPHLPHWLDKHAQLRNLSTSHLSIIPSNHNIVPSHHTITSSNNIVKLLHFTVAPSNHIVI